MTAAGRPENAGPGASILIACACLLLWLPFVLPVASGRVLHGDDLGWFHLPLRLFYSQCLASGDDPRWHPGLYCGFYVHGEGQVGMAHPLHQLLYGLLPPASAFQIEVAIGYPLMVAGMAAWLVRFGVRKDAALLGGLIFAFSPFNLLRYVHTNAVQVIAHLPWLLLALEVQARPRSDRERSFAGAAIGLLTASQCLLGYPQYVGFSLLVEGAYAAWRLGQSPTAWGRWLLAKGLGLLAGGRQILPHWDALRGSVRREPSREFLGTDSLHPWNLAQVFAPEAFQFGHYRDAGASAWPRHERVAYLGAVAPSAVAWLWIRRRAMRPWRAAISWACFLGIAAIVLALGKYSPLFPLYARVPLAGLFRGTNRFVVVAQLSASALAAIAFHDLAGRVGRRERLPWRSLLPLAVPVALAAAMGPFILGVASWRPGSSAPGQLDAMRGAVASALWMAGPAVGFCLAARGRRGGCAMIILLAAIDPAVHALKPIFAHDRPRPIVALVGPTAPGGPGSRVRAPLNESTPRGIRLVEGYVALAPARKLDYAATQALRIAGAGWASSRDAPGGWVAIPGALPRARLVSRVVASRDPRADLAAIDPATTALAHHPRAFPDGPAGKARVVLDRPGRIAVETDSAAPRFLVLSEAYHPGWKVADDGRPREVVATYGDFLGCEVGPGVHVISFDFDPPSDRRGSMISLCGLLGIASLAIGGCWRAHRRRAIAGDLDPSNPTCLTVGGGCRHMETPLPVETPLHPSST